MARVRSASDRRVVNLSLTDAGHEVVKVVPGVLASINEDFTRGFSAHEAAQMCDLLRRMATNGANLGATPCAAVPPTENEPS